MRQLTRRGGQWQNSSRPERLAARNTPLFPCASTAVLRWSLEKFDLARAASLMILDRRLLLVRRCTAAEEIV